MLYQSRLFNHDKWQCLWHKPLKFKCMTSTILFRAKSRRCIIAPAHWLILWHSLIFSVWLILLSVISLYVFSCFPLSNEGKINNFSVCVFVCTHTCSCGCELKLCQGRIQILRYGYLSENILQLFVQDIIFSANNIFSYNSISGSS